MKKKGQLQIFIMNPMVLVILTVLIVVFGYSYIKAHLPKPVDPTPIVKVNPLNTNLVFNVPLSNSSRDLITGEEGTSYGITYGDNFANFNGNSYIRFAKDKKFLPDQFGLSVCVKNDNILKHSVYISKFRSWTLQDWYTTSTNPITSRIEGLIYLNSTSWKSTGKSAPKDGAWQHIVMNYDKQSLKIFLDKNLDSQNTWIRNTMYDDLVSGLTIGNSDSKTKGVVGSMKNIRIYNATMTPEQINLAYDECI